MKVLIINNLNSGFGDGSIYDFIRSFSKEKDEIVIRNILHLSQIENYLSDSKNFDIVVAAGGDATISRTSYFLANTNIPILPYPSGVSNLIVQNLFLPTEPHALANIARAKKTLDFDVGEITINEQKFGFSCNAGAGYISKISKEAFQNRKQLGTFAYIGAALTNFKPETSDFELELDEGIIKADGIGILLLNFTKIGLELSLTHKNRPRDGKFDVVILKGKTAFKYIPALTAAALDRAIDFPGRSDALEIHLSSKVKVQANPEMTLHIDGKTQQLKTPFYAKVLKHATKYVVDKECIENYTES